MNYLECCDCQETPTVEEWHDANKGCEALGLINVPKGGFKDEDEFRVFQNESGSQLDCPVCGTVNCIEDINFY